MTAISPSKPLVASNLARLWLRIYCFGLPAEARARRSLELESDLWEHERDCAEREVAPAVAGVEVFSRVVRGMPADLLWRFQLEGPQMNIHIPWERAMGLSLILLVVLAPIAAGIDGYDTSEESWSSELSRLGAISDTQIRLNILFQTLAGLGLIALGAGIFSFLQPRARTTATFAGFGLAAAGVLTLGASALYVAFAQMADTYLDGGAGDDLLVISRSVALGMQRVAGAAMIVIASSVYILAAGLSRHALVPSGLRWIALGSVTCVAGALLAGVNDSLANIFAWPLFMSGLLLLLVWLFMAGGCLALGVRPRSTQAPTVISSNAM